MLWEGCIQNEEETYSSQNVMCWLGRLCRLLEKPHDCSAFEGILNYKRKHFKVKLISVLFRYINNYSVKRTQGTDMNVKDDADMCPEKKDVPMQNYIKCQNNNSHSKLVDFKSRIVFSNNMVSLYIA